MSIRRLPWGGLALSWWGQVRHIELMIENVMGEGFYEFTYNSAETLRVRDTASNSVSLHVGDWLWRDEHGDVRGGDADELAAAVDDWDARHRAAEPSAEEGAGGEPPARDGGAQEDAEPSTPRSAES